MYLLFSFLLLICNKIVSRTTILSLTIFSHIFIYLEAMESGRLPGDILDDIPCKYVNGTLVCEVLHSLFAVLT